MDNSPKIEEALARFEPGRRDALRKIALFSTLYAVPTVASFSMVNLGGVAEAQVSNQPVAAPVPASSAWSLAALAGGLAAAGAMLRRRRDPK